MTRRDLYRLGSRVLGGAIKLAVAVPALAFLVSPLRKKVAGQGGASDSGGSMETLTSLSQLKVGVPRSFPVIRDRNDAWVTYPSEPVGSVWLIRQPEGAKPEVIAYSAECPHLGCAINLTTDAREFLCPCHTSAFDFEGKPKNQVPPRPMDRLDVELTAETDPKVRVRFQKFRTLAEEKIPLA
ncbi:Arsenite oxidase subunit AioB precursor [Aquisphaera giovannonii]|uniref:Arsenite oxidase subunit AioB n=1 Tax=Aquisphaera giovannonii TaxID=406548 RepID=A0A5B9VZA9_9BACT|nr:Rieske 2Fe-2S domain-containing protein [Aquisphaera giovannonii]QEH33618.1 Arsenite oxidase subunit AioB precursor [Aquisphaera giovannonii]